MKWNRRIAIVDRSVLAHNVYKTLFKPLGFTLFHYKTLRDFKEQHDFKWDCRCFLINSNTFGNHFERHYEWFQKQPAIRSLPKIFLCDPKEKGVCGCLKNLPNAQFLMKPFCPDDLEDAVEKRG